MPESVAPDLSLPELATCPRPAEPYAVLRARGVHRCGVAWVVARPVDVAAALSAPTLSVAAGVGDKDGDAARLQARMARFSDGVDHARRRALVTHALPAPDGLGPAAARRAEGVIGRNTSAFDVMPLALAVPVAVLAAELGVAPGDIGRVVTATGRLCAGLAPSLVAGPWRPQDVDRAARELVGLLAPLAPDDDERVAAAASVLFQARDATAALIGTALLAAGDAVAGAEAAEAAVEYALRHDPPVQCTRRIALAEVTLGGVTIPRGATVWVLLAAAELAPPAPPATFGAGTHGCPGAAGAVALARGVVAAVLNGGWRAVPGQPVSYEARPNLRMPVQVLVARP